MIFSVFPDYVAKASNRLIRTQFCVFNAYALVRLETELKLFSTQQVRPIYLSGFSIC